MRIKKISIKDFRRFKNVEFQLGRRITVISGTNAVGKSTILGILGNSSELKAKEGRPLIHKQFRTEFSEIFRMSREHDPSGSNKIKVEFDNGEYRTMRTTWQFDKKLNSYRARLIPEYKDENNKTHSTKQRWPTLFLGLSRLFPLGESEGLNLKEKIYSMDSEFDNRFKKTYKSILSLPDEIDKTSTINIPETKRKTSVGISTKEYDSYANSSGQDNLGQILLAIESFRELKLSRANDYNGGMLLIDEIDATLHPSAQNRLFDYLFKESKSLDLQIVFTTHSLSLLQHIPQKIGHNSSDLNDIELYYLTIANISLKQYRNPDYNAIKANLMESPVHFDKKIQVMAEDDEARWFIHRIIEGTDLANRLELMPIKMSCTSILSLMKGDPRYFSSKIVILDGDVNATTDHRLKEEYEFLKNSPIYLITTLPSTTSPEKEIYNFLISRSAESIDYLSQDQCFNLGISLQVFEHANFDKQDRNAWKNWFNKYKDIFDSTCLYDYYKKANKKKIDDFINELLELYKVLSQKGYAPGLPD
ncbi:ATP-dependent nuclease [Veillonella magna]|uniref:ATP-dependent nuclease n=1 Tax=Veillonella magna TaxID=464322 RepID=UPI0023EF8ED5|nr:AAA family ATPase [Veillonella magna]